MTRCSPRHICIFSKPVVQILQWANLIALLHYAALGTWPQALHKEIQISPYWTQLASYSALSVIFLSFPIGGFVGDVYFSRYRAVTLGLILTTLCLISTSIGSILLFLTDSEQINSQYRIIPIVLLIFSFILLVIGLSIFSSNVLQFGLDQLMEKPSESLGVFVHWLVWAIKLGKEINGIVFLLANCQKIVHKLLFFEPVIFLAAFILLFCIVYCTRHHFNKDRVKYNPYKMIVRVLNFARKHKYPVGPVSAFAYCYGYWPSRLDYAKERYGGPFTTSDVEDVKSFKSVFLLLLALGPIFVTDVPTNSYFYSFFHNHTGDSLIFEANATCINKTVSVLISAVVELLAFPLYMWLIYSVLRNRTPKILHRIIVAAFVKILVISYMCTTDFIGHLVLSREHNQTANCMFIDKLPRKTLHIHWTVEIFSVFGGSFAHNVFLAAVFELISAQSPNTMKGVLVRSSFAVMGTFSVLGALFSIPFSLNGIWRDGYLGQHPPVISCAFGYYIVCISVALVGLVCFMVAAKRYKYRRRDEEPYSQACVEEIFARRIDNRHSIIREEYEQLNGSNMEEY